MADPIAYRLVRSDRKTLAIHILQDGTVEVRAPRRLSSARISAFVQERGDWIRKHQEKMMLRARRHEARDWEQLKADTLVWNSGAGGQMLIRKIEAWARRMGVSFGRVRVKDMKTRWGSCSVKGDLNFCWKIFLLPEHCADYLIIHELAHRRHMDHSKEFWSFVAEFCPDHKAARKELENYL